MYKEATYKRCIICGGIFQIRPTVVAERKTCSMACRAELYKLNRLGSQNSNWRGGQLKAVCLNCGQEFSYKRKERIIRKYCSLTCVGAVKSKRGASLDNGNIIRTRRYAQRHREEILNRSRRKRLELKTKVLTHYGKGILACVICGEKRLPCLSLDHINGDGYKNRVGYPWYVMNNFPTGFQTLCMNCQFIKKFENNECGRKRKVSEEA